MEKVDAERQLFVSDNRVKELCNTDYCLNKEARVSEIEEGIILPLRKRSDLTVIAFEGGVCDKDGKFITGHCRRLKAKNPGLSAMRAYSLQETPQRRHETVVFGGLIAWHFGTQLGDGLSRVWWFADHPDTQYKIVFLKAPYQIWSSPFSSKNINTILEVMGITSERMEIIEEPTQFDKIIVPEESFHLWSGYRPAWLKSYDLIQSKVKEGPYKRIYLSRTAFVKNTDCDGINEEYFEEFYRKRGYQIIHPEQLDFLEQVSLLYGADEVVCTSGTLVVMLAFCKPHTKVTILNRCNSFWQAWLYPLQERRLDYTIVDAHYNFLPAVIDGQNIYLYGPTNAWKEYLDKNGIAYEPDEVSVEKHVAPYLYSYLCKWAEIYERKVRYKQVCNTSLVDILANLNDMFLQRKIDKTEYPDRKDLMKLQKEKAALEGDISMLQTKASVLEDSFKSVLKDMVEAGNALSVQLSRATDAAIEKNSNDAKALAQAKDEVGTWRLKAIRLEEEAAHWEREFHSAEKGKTRWKNQVRGMESSLSWRITKPLRAFKALLKRIFK